LSAFKTLTVFLQYLAEVLQRRVNSGAAERRAHVVHQAVDAAVPRQRRLDDGLPSCFLGHVRHNGEQVRGRWDVRDVPCGADDGGAAGYASAGTKTLASRSWWQMAYPVVLRLRFRWHEDSRLGGRGKVGEREEECATGMPTNESPGQVRANA
jgi:hypothetical protein